jgi:hypothetical protein
MHSIRVLAALSPPSLIKTTLPMLVGSKNVLFGVCVCDFVLSGVLALRETTL